VLPFAVLHHPLWDYGIVFALLLGILFAFTVASYPSKWPFGEGLFSVVYAWLDLQKRNCGFGYSSLWSLARLTHVPGGVARRCHQQKCFGLWRGDHHYRLHHQERGIILIIKDPPLA
jgi:hypothetical protein